jgi:lipopolysaccharide transport system ATP-binding protein
MQTSKSEIISLQRVGLYYTRRTGKLKRNRFWALKDVSFKLHQGETLGVIGKNGVGKTTLLRLLAGIITPSTGQVIKHQKSTSISLMTLTVGFVPLLTGRDNAILSGMLLGLTKKEVVALIDQIIDFSELEDFFNEPIHTYSSGMRMRLGFSIAYFANPDVLLLDEVLGVGDADFQRKSTDAMKKRIQSDKTVVIASHNAATLREVCDRLIWIEDGKTKREGTPDEILNLYQKK